MPAVREPPDAERLEARALEAPTDRPRGPHEVARRGAVASVPRNHHIQALRGIAASLVVLSHALDPLVEHGLLPLWFRPVAFSMGGLGVTTFFVISGFIMTTISYDDFGHARNAVSFVKRRLIRIVPTYWIATVVAFMLYQLLPLTRHPSLVEFAKSLVFVPYATPGLSDMQPVLGQGWTLNYEMFFYALFALALLLPRRLGLLALLVTFMGIVVGGSFIKPLSDPSSPTTIVTFLADPIILLFAVGIALGILKRQRGNTWRLRFPFWVALSLLGFQVACNMAFLVPPRLPFPEAAATWIAAAFAVAACVWAVPSRSGRFEAISEALGDASYSTYLFHVFVIAAMKMVFPIVSLPAGVAFVVIAVVVSNVFGVVFSRIVERPISAMFRSRARPIEVPAAAL
jgi:exopolysaccharide production protein ExoZ